MTRHRFVGAAIVISLCAAALAAQQAAQPSFKSGTPVVAVYSTVTNSQGRLVPDLTRDDFTVDDNGKPQTLTLFANDIQPITVVMLLDRSGSMKSNFRLEEAAAAAFVGAMGPKDKARIGSFAKGIQVDPEDFSADHETLFKILENDLQADGPTPLWNAVDVGIDKLLLEPGRRVVLVLTDGVDAPMNFSNHNKSLKDVMRRAEERDIMIYAIGLAGETGMPRMSPRGTDDQNRSPGPGAFGGLGGRGLGGYGGNAPQLEKPDDGLPKIAEATGGGYFELTSTADLARTFTRVADELHHQYALGFAPEKLDGKMHELTVHMSTPSLRARARKRYLATPARTSP